MKNIDKLLRQARKAAHGRTNELDNYDFTRLTTAELKELALSDLAEERFNELIGKAARFNLGGE